MRNANVEFIRVKKWEITWNVIIKLGLLIFVGTTGCCRCRMDILGWVSHCCDPVDV